MNKEKRKRKKKDEEVPCMIKDSHLFNDGKY